MTLVGPYTVGRAVPHRGEGGSLIPPPGGWLGGGLPGPYVYDTHSARRVPAVGRALGLFGGMCKQMDMHCYRGGTPLPQPALLKHPDPDQAPSWFIQVSVEDYLLAGNAICLITVRGADGWPLAVQWLPASWVSIKWQVGDPASVEYWFGREQLPTEDVVHVKRGADRSFPVRGVGVVEEYLGTLDRVAMEEEYERGALAGGAVPSVALITPTPTLSPEEAEEAKERWMVLHAGPGREPAILPNGTQVVPLAWSPTDTQLTEARKASLTDIANLFNLDGYWLGAPVAGMTYRTAGPQYQQILRTSLEPVLVDFEHVWGDAWFPRGQELRFDRNKLLRDDMATTTSALTALVSGGIISVEEAREYLALPVSPHGAATALHADGGTSTVGGGQAPEELGGTAA